MTLIRRKYVEQFANDSLHAARISIITESPAKRRTAPLENAEKCLGCLRTAHDYQSMNIFGFGK